VAAVSSSRRRDGGCRVAGQRGAVLQGPAV